MKQQNKISLETTEQQQKRVLTKLHKELEMLELALADKKEQIKLHEKVLEAIVKG